MSDDWATVAAGEEVEIVRDDWITVAAGDGVGGTKAAAAVWVASLLVGNCLTINSAIFANST